MIRLVRPEEVDDLWPFLAQGMDRACRKARSDRTAVEIYQACRVGAWFLHVAEEGNELLGAIATHIVRDTVVVDAMCGRQMKRWLPELITLPFWKMNGVRRAEWGGRRGLKIVPGAKPIRTSFELEL